MLIPPAALRLCFDFLLSHCGLSGYFDKNMQDVSPIRGTSILNKAHTCNGRLLAISICRRHQLPPHQQPPPALPFCPPHWVQTERPTFKHTPSLSQGHKYIGCINSAVSLQTSVKYFFLPSQGTQGFSAEGPSVYFVLPGGIFPFEWTHAVLV